MTTHINDPDIYTNGLNVDCPRCKQHALTPWDSLDNRMLARLRSHVFFSALDAIAAVNLAKHDVAKSERAT
ncbi:MAG: hypothetical protein ACRDFW_05985 [bacterium]